MPINRIQYQVLAPPPSPAAIPQSNEATSHQPWSEPVRQRIAPVLAVALAASGLFAPVLAPQRDVAFPSGSWGHPPQASRLFQYQALAWPVPQGGEVVTADKWFKALSEPVRLPPRLRAGLEPVQAFSNIYPQYLSFIEPFSSPVRFKPDLGTARQPFYFAEPFSQTQPETVTESRWHQPWSEPVRFKPRLHESLQEFFKYHPAPSPFVATGWYNWLSTPSAYLVKPWIPSTEQHYFEFEPFIPEPGMEMPWFSWLTEPVRQKIGLRPWQQPFYVADTKPTVSFGWFENLGDPKVLPDHRRGISARFQQTLAFTEFVFQEPTSEDKWHQAWSEPVRLKPDLGASRQSYFLAPTPYVITVVLAVTETKDVFSGALSDATSFNQAAVSITEIVPKYANVGSAYVSATFANVSIIEIEA